MGGACRRHHPRDRNDRVSRLEASNDALPEFIMKKMYPSEEFENRKRAEHLLADEKVKDYRRAGH